MQVGLNPVQGGSHPDIHAAPDTAGRAISMNGYIEDNLDGLFTAFVGPYYAQHRAEYMERLRLIYSEDTGRALIHRLNMIGEEDRIYPVLDFVIPPEDDADENPLVRYVNRAIQIDNGVVIWDPLCMSLDRRSPDYAAQYSQVESCLIELRRQLESSGSPASHEPAIPNDPHPVEAPSERLSGLNAARPYHLPVWKGKTKSVTLFGNLPVRVSQGLAAHKDDVKAVLGEIAKTVPGQILFSELGVCARYGATLIVADGNGRSGLTTTKNGDLVWLFDKRDLARRCIQRELATSDKPVYSAFVDLVAARDAQGAKLGEDFPWISSNWLDRRTVVDQFYQGIKTTPARHIDGAAPTRSPGRANQPQGLGGIGHAGTPDSAAHPPDPRPIAQANTGWTVPHAVVHDSQVDPARDGGAPSEWRADRTGSWRGHGIQRAVTGMIRAVQGRLGLVNTPRESMQERVYNAVVAPAPNYSVPNPYITISRE